VLPGAREGRLTNNHVGGEKKKKGKKESPDGLGEKQSAHTTIVLSGEKGKTLFCIFLCQWEKGKEERKTNNNGRKGGKGGSPNGPSNTKKR